MTVASTRRASVSLSHNNASRVTGEGKRRVMHSRSTIRRVRDVGKKEEEENLFRLNCKTRMIHDYFLITFCEVIALGKFENRLNNDEARGKINEK